MQSIYIYIPKTTHISRVHSAAAVLYLQFVLQVILFPPWNMFIIIIIIIIIYHLYAGYLQLYMWKEPRF
jgi:energy-coupling factor transporter transmembrane protein EcfT